MESVTLSESQINRLINDGIIQVKASAGTIVTIRQSYIKDAAAPIINRDKKVFSNAEIENIKRTSSMMADTFKLGY